MPNKRVRSAAPGTYLGFSLQPLRLAYYLLTQNDDVAVSLESVEDVAVHSGSGVILEQTKSALSANPVSDWSPDLWKAFYNWIDAIEIGAINLLTTEFRIYVTPVHSGRLVELLSAAHSDSAADRAVAKIQSDLKALSRKPSCFKYLKRLLEYDVAKRRELIKRFTLESEHVDPVDALRKVVRVTVSAAMVDRCCEYAIGLAKEAVDRSLRQGGNGAIQVQDFRAKFIAFVRSNDLGRLLVSIGAPPTVESVKALQQSEPTFVRQLQAIEMADDAVLQAIADFMQASSDKTAWAESGDIVRESLDEMDNALVREHSLVRLEVEEQGKDKDAGAKGRLVYVGCMKTRTQLEGRVVPSHFVPGCFHDLADRLRVGWHPNYVELFEDKATS